jgi:hypothetical protein
MNAAYYLLSYTATWSAVSKTVGERIFMSGSRAFVIYQALLVLVVAVIIIISSSSSKS